MVSFAHVGQKRRHLPPCVLRCFRLQSRRPRVIRALLVLLGCLWVHFCALLEKRALRLISVCVSGFSEHVLAAGFTRVHNLLLTFFSFTFLKPKSKHMHFLTCQTKRWRELNQQYSFGILPLRIVKSKRQQSRTVTSTDNEKG